MLKKKDILLITKALLSGTTFILLINLLNNFVFLETGPLKRILILLGGDFIGGGYIQWITIIAFNWALFEIFQKKKIIIAEASYFKAKLLPENEKHLLMASDVYEIHQSIRDFESKHDKTLLTQLIKNACAKLRSTKNISEVLIH